MSRIKLIFGCVSAVTLLVPMAVCGFTRALAAQELPYPLIAARIVTALQPARGERVLLRFDPKTMAGLEPAVKQALEKTGARVESLTYGPAPDLDARLQQTDIYIWLPAGPGADTPSDQRAILGRWLAAGKGRQIHFHWLDGTRDPDGLPLPHAAAYDRVYLDALDIDYAALSSEMEQAISRLRVETVRVTTPAGTDIRFRVGTRPFNKQDGDASASRMRTAVIPIDREIELPAGVLRVAPIEDTVDGVIVIPAARFSDAQATGIRLRFAKGTIVRATADRSEASLTAFLASEPGANHFRELGLGFNPKLVVPPGERALPYYGYGAGVVRMSVGDNSELGGRVTGGGVRWLFFPDATVTIGSDVLVKDGELLPRASILKRKRPALAGLH